MQTLLESFRQQQIAGRGGGTDKLPIKKIPPNANFFDLGRLRLHSHGTGKISMARVATSSDAVIPYEKEFSSMHLPSMDRSQNACTGTQPKMTEKRKLISQPTHTQAIMTVTVRNRCTGNTR